MYNPSNLLLGCLLVATSNGLSPIPSRAPAGAEIVVEGLKRVSADEVHLTVKVTNKANHPIFLAGIKYDSGPSPELVFIEQRLPREDWKTITCVENPPPDVIKLHPGEAISEVSWWKVPMIGVCKNLIIRWEGKFRFRLEYFESEKQARTYLKNFYSARREEAHAAVAFSEPFEIPPTNNPEH